MRGPLAGGLTALILWPGLSATEVTVTEEALGPAPAKADRIGRQAYSPDRRHTSWFIRRDGQVVHFIDAKERGTYDDHLVRSLVFSPDGGHVAAAVSRDGQWLVTLDGEDGPESDWVSKPIFSEDSAHVAYVARRDAEHLVIVDSVERARSEHAISRLVLGADASELAYVVTRDSSSEFPSETAVFRGESGPEYGWIGDPQVTTYQGRTIAIYRAWAEEKWTLVVDGVPGPFYDYVSEPVLAPDGAHLAYVAQDGEAWHVVLDGRPGAAYDGIDAGRVRFSPDGNHLAYIARTGEMECLVMDGEEGETGRWVSGAVFSPDSRRYACTSSTRLPTGERRAKAIVDGAEGPAFERVGRPEFSEDSRHVYYTAEAEEDEEFLVIDDEPTLCPRDNLTVVFTPEGPHIAFWSREEGGGRTVVDGEPGPKGAGASKPHFTPNTRHAVYMIRPEADGPWQIVIDHEPVGPLYDRLAWPSLVTNSQAEWLLVRDQVLYRVTATFE